jgi:acetyltransferase-like isoleucine patch superfamily enzyme
MEQYGINRIGENSQIFENVILGFPSRQNIGRTHYNGVEIGKNAILRPGTTIYCDVNIGDDFSSGHNVLIRENTTIGDRVAIGSGTIIEGHISMGSDVRVQSGAFIPINTVIGDGVFIGPYAVLTNDRYPPTGLPALVGPIIEDYAIIGANSTLLPGIRLGRGSAVAAGAVVTRDVPAGTLAVGVPARIQPLPDAMRRIA